MAIPTLNAVGFCAHYSEQGDWAFDYALDLSRRHGIQLNVFHFLSDPYDPDSYPPIHLPRKELSELIVEKERELRMYYDDRAGDYLDVGFRLCENNEWLELHRCLVDQEFQILVLGNPGPEATVRLEANGGIRRQLHLPRHPCGAGQPPAVSFERCGGSDQRQAGASRKTPGEKSNWWPGKRSPTFPPL